MNFIKTRRLLYSNPRLLGRNTILLILALSLWEVPFVRSQTNNNILAKVGEKEITVEDFLQRSELTIRPNNYKNKNVTLNNLISEKILALEAEQNKESLIPAIQNELKGIKEQLMRDKLYYDEAFNKVELDSSEIKNTYRLSTREYELEFYTISDDSMKLRIEEILESAPELTNQIFKDLEEIVGKKPIHKIKYLDPDDELINQAFFKTLLDTGDVIGPIRLSNGNYILARVMNWADYPIIGPADQQTRWNEVKDKMHEMEANKLWYSFIGNVMKGKKIEFDKNSFKLLSDLAYKYYWQNIDADSLNIRISEIPIPETKVNLDSPFFKIDNTVWTISDFKNELKYHPLVYRKKYSDIVDFRQEFKYAIVDMMRDYYLTQEAYKRSLDNSPDINKTIGTWKDAFLANEYMKSICGMAVEEGIVNKSDYSSRTKYWESYLGRLQIKYSDVIWINLEELKKISLSNVDFVAMRPGVPYPLPVPRFPMFIPSGNINYAEK